MDFHKIVDGVVVPLTAEEYAAEMASQATAVLPTPASPTKEQLLAQLQALQAQIQALE